MTRTLSVPSRTATPTASRLSAVLIALLLAIGSTRSLAQPTDSPVDSTWTPKPPVFWFGVYGGLLFPTYQVSLAASTLADNNPKLAALPGSLLTSGSGQGFLGGAFIEVPINRNSLAIGLRIGAQSQSGSLEGAATAAGGRVSDRNGTPVAGAVLNEKVDVEMLHITALPYIRTEPFEFPLYFLLGPMLHIPSSMTYTYREEILSPAGASFTGSTGRSNVQVLASGREFSAMNNNARPSPGFGFVLAPGYRLAISPWFEAFGELQIQQMAGEYLSNLPEGERWNSSTAALVVGIRLGIGGETSPPRRPPVKKPPVALDTTKKGLPVDTLFGAKGVGDDGALSDTLTIVPKRIQASEFHALLPYVFFETGSDSIPPRYRRVDRRGRRGFMVERLARGNTLDLYYELLNIVGKRLRDNRSVKVTLIGRTSDLEDDSTLAYRRAEGIKKYLVDVWQIAERRITIDTTNRGGDIKQSEVDPDSRAVEQQRVEIVSDGFVAEAPVELPDTATLAPLGMVRFLPPTTGLDTNEAVDSWSLDVKIGDVTIKEAVTGTGAPPKQIDFTLQNRPDLDIRGDAVTITSTLTIRDTLYENLATLTSRPLPVRQQGTFEVERNVEDGRYVDTYTLLLYGFDSSDVSDYTRGALDIIQRSMDSTSRLSITGYTDRIGLPYYNKALSKRRAETAAQLLGVGNGSPRLQSLNGAGERGDLYDNDLPEGRYYSRTATVVVETPIPGAAPTDNGVTPRRRRTRTAEPQGE